MPNRRFMLGSLLAAVAAPSRAWAQSPAPPAHIRVAITSADQFAEAYYARDAGFFSKAGLDVEIVGMSTGGQIATAVASGAVDMGMSNTGQLANAIVHGAPFVIVASGGLYSSAAPATALVVAKNSAAHAARDLEGKTVSVTALRDITQIGPTAWMTRNGADATKAKFVEIPFSEVSAALDRGTIDAGMLAEPWLSTGIAAGTIRVLAYVFTDIAPTFVLSPWFATADYYRQNSDLVRRFTRALYDSARWSNAHHPETAAILAKYGKFDPIALQRMNRSIFATSLDLAQLQPALTVMYKYGAIDKPLQADAIVAK